jgi:hypothetical protein
MHQSNQKQNQQTRSTLLLLELLSNDVLYSTYSTYIKQPAKPPTLEQKKNRKIEQQKIKQKIKQQKIEQKNNIINDILMQLDQLHIHNPSL